MNEFHVDDRSNRERMEAGDWYLGDDPELIAEGRRAATLSAQYHAAFTSGDDAHAILDQLIGQLGAHVEIRPPLYVDYGRYISIGAGTYINYNFTALDVAAITIGRDCQIGPNVQLLPPTHPVPAEPRQQKWEAGHPITIGDNVWLGGGVIVLAGVTIGDNSVVGAGAVVTKDIPADVVAVGNPARVIKPLPSD